MKKCSLKPVVGRDLTRNHKSNRLEDEDDDYDEDDKAEEGFLDWNISSHDEGGVGVWTQTPHLSVDDNFSICLALPCMEAHFCHD